MLYMAAAEVLHSRGKSAEKNPDTERMRRKSQLAYYEKHLPMWAPFLKMWLKLRGNSSHR